ncbi:MAG: histidine triad nucleotide-binding protein [Oscillospiraceae bacterium]|jgi:histidine triad (HIT) family protein|nr:histidine triad nucleotide-binding protein [Oscillospiraceae bacterium]
MSEKVSDCIFCKIAAGEIPSDKVYEDERVLAFRDINPQAPTHILVIPKEHIDSAADITAENAPLAARCLEIIADVAKAEGLSGGFRVITNVGEDGGQSVRHLHFHLLGGVKMNEGLL